ncbi:hypothetical protein OED01_13370 [Microbacterium sp. M28]|uniref:hypothetical protein n=1 Tax=Microbacterium sp. M28 TaxID=2962064 RepID=UPI0021F4D51A|nr:hypothetical protein [Microbacterium sp. M28]UYO96584.1 hypothetical protein OED01_13370 [Microbacterium sp. M28]
MVSKRDYWWRTDAMTWRAHDWSIEVRGDELAEIRYGGRMLLRAVRAAVRDSGWLTVPVTVLSVASDASSLTMHLQHDGLGARLDSTLRVAAQADALRIEWDAVNTDAFETNRTGLVVLHPATDAGRPAVVVHPDGSSEAVAFPTVISPHQPIVGIRKLRVDDDFALKFAGGVFEMEDQRNWTDASFKTYSRPLELPFPYPLDAGERVRQSITIRALGTGPVPSSDSGAVALVAGGTVPSFGVEASTAPGPVPVSDAGSFRVVELNLATPNWRAALERAAGDGVPLDVRIVTDGSAPVLAEGVREVAQYADAPGVLRMTAFDATEHVSDSRVVSALRAAMAASGLSLPVLAGARSHFTELNREQARIARDVDGIVVNTTPLFHTLDTEQLVEALAMQRLIAEQAVSIAGGLPVHIGPVSLRPRFNNVATTPEPAPRRTDLSEGYGAEFTGAVDARQGAPELGAWVIASAAAFAVPGVASVSWFETWGPRGLASADGRTPAADAVDALVSLAGGTLLSGMTADGLVWAISSRTDAGVTVLVANLDREERRVEVDGIGEVTVDTGAWVRVQH